MNLSTLNAAQRSIVEKEFKKCEPLSGFSVLVGALLSVSITAGLLLKVFSYSGEQLDNLVSFGVWVYLAVYAFSAVCCFFIFLLVCFRIEKYKEQTVFPWMRKAKEHHEFMLSFLTFVKPSNFIVKALRILDLPIIFCLAVLGWIFTAISLMSFLLLLLVFKKVMSEILLSYFSGLTAEVIAGLEAGKDV